MPQWLLDLFGTYGYLVVFAGIFLENAGLPVPGETTLLAGGVLARTGTLSLGSVMAVATCAAILGDNLGFWIGRQGGRALAERHGRTVGLTPARLADFDAFFARYGAGTVFIARFVTGLRVFCAILAGGSEMPWSTFLIFNATGAVVWAVTIATAGYSVAYSWERLQRLVGVTGLIALLIVVIFAAVALIGARQEQKPW